VVEGSSCSPVLLDNFKKRNETHLLLRLSSSQKYFGESSSSDIFRNVFAHQFWFAVFWHPSKIRSVTIYTNYQHPAKELDLGCLLTEFPFSFTLPCLAPSSP